MDGLRPLPERSRLGEKNCFEVSSRLSEIREAVLARIPTDRSRPERTQKWTSGTDCLDRAGAAPGRTLGHARLGMSIAQLLSIRMREIANAEFGQNRVRAWRRISESFTWASWSLLSRIYHTRTSMGRQSQGPKGPVIGLTIRYDRLDNFWFVLNARACACRQASHRGRSSLFATTWIGCC